MSNEAAAYEQQLAEKAEFLDQRKLQRDPKTEVMRGLFEILLYYGVILLVAAALAVCVGIGSHAILGEGNSNAVWILSATLVSFLVAAGGINYLLDGEAKPLRRSALEQFTRRYGYPLILLAGLCGGWYASQYNDAYSDIAVVKSAVLRACLQSASCVAKATQLNGGNNPRYVLGPDGRPYPE